MESLPWILISVLVLLGVLGIIAIVYSRKYGRREPDYYNFFIMGVIWVGAGVALGIGSGSWFLFIMGFAFMVIGLVHKTKWKKNIADRKNKWNSLSKKDKKILLWFRWVMVGVLILGLLAFVWFSLKVGGL